MATLIQTLPFLVDGLLMTLLVSACVIVLSLIVGLPLGCVLAFGPLWARVPIRLYADFVRGVPILVLLYFVYYGPVSYTHLDVYKRQVLDRAGNADGDIELRGDDFAGLAHLPIVRCIARIDSGAAGTNGGCLLYTSRCV